MIDKIGGFLVERAIHFTVKTVADAFSNNSKEETNNHSSSEDYDYDAVRTMLDNCDADFKAQIAQGVEAFEAEDYDTAYSIFSEYSDAISLYYMGYMTYKGLGCDANKIEGIKLFHKSADQGDIYSQYYLGFIYMTDEEYEDQAKSYKWFMEAAKQGHITAQYFVGCCFENGEGVEKNQKSAIKWYKKAAQQGDADAQYNLGRIHLFDFEDYPVALGWLEMAVAQENAKAQWLLAVCYEGGLGVDVDDDKAIELYTKAAEQGEENSQCRLGRIYIDMSEYDTAIGWIEKGVERNSPEAINLLGCCYTDGLGVDVDPAKAMELFNKAAAAGNILAIANIGECYEKFDKDYKSAIEWYQIAADKGHENSVESIARCKELMNGASSTSCSTSSATSYSNTIAFNANEVEYRDELQEILADGEISASERRLLRKIQTQLGISDERAAQIEESLYETDTLTADEQEYLDEFRECGEDGVLTASERRLLNRIRLKLGISEERAAEIENCK